MLLSLSKKDESPVSPAELVGVKGCVAHFSPYSFCQLKLQILQAQTASSKNVMGNVRFWEAPKHKEPLLRKFLLALLPD